MKKIIKILIILLSVIVIALMVIAISLYFNGANNLEYQNFSMPELEKTLKKVNDRLDYYAVKDCVEKYYLYYEIAFNAKDYYEMTYQTTDNSEDSIREYELQNTKVLYNMLDEEYITKKEITIDNIKAKIRKINKPNLNITNIYMTGISENIEVFLVEGMLYDEDFQNINNFQIILKVDISNRTFSILPQEYVEEKYNNIKSEEELKINVQEEIKANNNNKYKVSSITEEKYVKDLFAKLKNEIEYFPELVYNKLDWEYRNVKYESFEDFQEHLKNYKEKYYKMRIEKYQKIIGDDYTQYICIDQNGNYYVFNQSSVMDYSLMLDDYTIDPLSFVEKYDSVEDYEKVVLNIQKLIKATNNSDYEYVYSKINSSFKETNFKTQQEFERFIKEKYNKDDVITYKKYEDISGVFVYYIEVANANGGNKREGKIVMQLKDNRDFEVSFSEDI